MHILSNLDRMKQQILIKSLKSLRNSKIIHFLSYRPSDLQKKKDGVRTNLPVTLLMCQL